MATSIFDGPLHVPGSMQAYLAAYFGSPVADPNSDAGPSMFYQGTAVLDPRLVYQKDKVQGYTGVVQGFQDMTLLRSVSAVPVAVSAARIASAATVTLNTPIVLAGNVQGFTRGVPMRPFSNALNGTAPIIVSALDFGFAFCNCTVGNATVTVSDSRMFVPGMPLIIGNVGNAGGVSCLATQVATIASPTTITLVPQALPLATVANCPVGTGDLWGPSPNGFPLPQAHYPFVAGGPGLFLDPRQAISRGLTITGGALSVGGNMTVTGWDIYGMPMRETIAVPAIGTGFGKKAFKYINQVIPAFTDPAPYTVGVSDVFGFHFRAPFWEETVTLWAGAANVATTGFVAADQTEIATGLTGDVRGTMQVGPAGGGAGGSANASNGNLVALVMAGRRLEMRQFINTGAMLRSSPAEPKYMFGVNQF